MYLILIVIVFACIMSVCVRVIVTHPISTVRYGVIDLYKYFRYRCWNICATGTISCYVGLFGKVKHYLQYTRSYLYISGTTTG